MSMASLAVSGAARAPVARMGAPARAPVKAVGGSAFMPAKLASKMTMKSSLAGAYSLSIRVWRGDDGASLVSRASCRRRRIPTSQIRRSGTRAGATSNPPGAVSGPPSATFSSHPALFRVSLTNPISPLSTPLRRRHAFRDGDSQARRGPWGVGCDRGWQVPRLHPPRHPPRARSHLRLPRPSPDRLRPQGAEAPSQEGTQVPRPRRRGERMEQGEEEVPQVRTSRRGLLISRGFFLSGIS